MTITTRRQFVSCAPAILGGSAALSACSKDADGEGFEAIQRTRCHVRAATASKALRSARSYERFALQATALGIRNAFMNQPVEVPSVRPRFAAAMGLAGRRPDLVVRFGRGPTLPPSLRRPVQAVLI